MVTPGELIKDFKASFFKTHGFVPISESEGKIAVVLENPNYLPARDSSSGSFKRRSWSTASPP